MLALFQSVQLAPYVISLPLADNWTAATSERSHDLVTPTTGDCANMQRTAATNSQKHPFAGNHFKQEKCRKINNNEKLNHAP